MRIPAVVAGRRPAPLNQDTEPGKSLLDLVKPYRDSIVHASPFDAPTKFGGYKKLEKIYSLEFDTVRTAVEKTLEAIAAIHSFIQAALRGPTGFPP